jgi:hypothetical protein
VDDKQDEKPGLPTLSDADIKTVRVERRSFLAIVGLPSVAAAAAVLASACGGADHCDFDDGTDADAFDLPGRGRHDACDNDHN